MQGAVSSGHVGEMGEAHHQSTWSYGVTVSTLDSESSDRGSNPRRTLSKFARARLKTEKSSVRASPLVLFWIGAVNGNAMLCSTLFGINMLSWRVP